MGRELPRARRAGPGRHGRALSRGHARGDRRRAAGAARRRRRGADRHPRPARARSDHRRPRQHRRAHLVGPRPARGDRRRGGRPGAPPGARRDGPAGAALRPLLQDLHPADGHDLLAGLAQLRRHRAGLDRRPGPPDRPRRAAPDRDRRAGDVRGVLRHPGPGRAGLPVHLLLRGGVPLRLLLAAGQGPGLLLLARRPGVPRLPPSRHPPGAGQRGAVGPARPGVRLRPAGRRRQPEPRFPTAARESA